MFDCDAEPDVGAFFIVNSGFNIPTLLNKASDLADDGFIKF